MAVLNGLPDYFDHFISAVDALRSETTTFSLELVKSCVLREEQRMDMWAKATQAKAEAAALVFREPHGEPYHDN